MFLLRCVRTEWQRTDQQAADLLFRRGHVAEISPWPPYSGHLRFANRSPFMAILPHLVDLSMVICSP